MVGGFFGERREELGIFRRKVNSVVVVRWAMTGEPMRWGRIHSERFTKWFGVHGLG